MNIQETIAVFKNKVDIKYQPCPTKIFFLNHTGYDDGFIVAASCLRKQISFFSRTLKTG